jgi:hypothetical protein
MAVLGVDRLAKDGRPLSAPPSWPKVIATTLRLWIQRHVASPRPSAPTNSRRFRAIAAVVAIVVVAGSLTIIAVSRHGSAQASPPARPTAVATTAAPTTAAPTTAAPGSSSSSHLSTKALAAAAASRQQAAAWVAAQVGRGTIVACDPLTCAALQQHGFPSADLATLGAGTGDPLGSGIVVSTLAVRSQLGARLTSVYAPTAIASFGSGPALVQVLVTAPGGSAAYLSAEHADLLARRTAGHELAGNKNIDAPPKARAELESGQVDSRLLITLAALTHKFSLQILGFSDAGPGAGSSGPLRLLTVTTSSTSYLHQLLAFLDAQRPPLLAMISQRRHGRMTIVQIHFTAPSPTGLLPSGA